MRLCKEFFLMLIDGYCQSHAVLVAVIHKHGGVLN